MSFLPSDGKGSSIGNPVSTTKELFDTLYLPPSAKLRAEYLVEANRCHPDMAGDNEFRAKMLERRFQRLTMAWEAYTGECRNSLPEPSAERFTKSLRETFAATETQSESDGTARDRAKAEYLEDRGESVSCEGGDSVHPH